MSINFTATQIKLFGFTPKFTWDEFTKQHSDIAREIKKSVTPLFLDFEDTEMKIRTESKKILELHAFNIDKFIENEKRKKKDMKEEIGIDMRAIKRQRYDSDEEDGNEWGGFESRKVENYVREEFWDKDKEDEKIYYDARERMDDTGDVEEYIDLIETALRKLIRGK